jgi:glycosyltransferase involved in cell wall biosynthesis
MFIINNLGGGGAERVVSNLCKGMGNYEKSVITFDDIIKQEVKANLIFINSPPVKTIFKKLVRFFIMAYKIKNLKRRIKPDYAISALEPCNLLNVITKGKEKTILTFHSNWSTLLAEDPYFAKGIFGKIRSFIYKFAFKFLYNRADVLVSVSRDVAQDLIVNFGLNPNKMKVIYNPVPIEEIEKLSKEQLGNYESIFKYPVLITAGRLTRSKGQWYLLRIFKKLKETHLSLKLVILGEGELKDYLVEYSQNLNLKTFVWDKDNFSEEYDVYFFGVSKKSFQIYF